MIHNYGEATRAFTKFQKLTVPVGTAESFDVFISAAKISAAMPVWPRYGNFYLWQEARVSSFTFVSLVLLSLVTSINRSTTRGRVRTIETRLRSSIKHERRKIVKHYPEVKGIEIKESKVDSLLREPCRQIAFLSLKIYSSLNGKSGIEQQYACIRSLWISEETPVIYSEKKNHWKSAISKRYVTTHTDIIQYTIFTLSQIEWYRSFVLWKLKRRGKFIEMVFSKWGSFYVLPFL